MTPERMRQIADLYHAARQCEQSARAALLAQAEPELRNEVESLLAQHSSQGPLERPAVEIAAQLLEFSTATNLTIGAQLGPYKIEAPLGAGGMGVVYRARDTRLGRTVALKVSKGQFSARFEKEARAIASLNHPNICTLHDVGPNYLVMELVEGPTLADRLKQGAIPLEQSLTIARQIKDALDAAHEKGMVHRDLKPANVKIKSDGSVKVLDFGLAKVSKPAAPAESAENSPDLTSEQVARTGTIMGTAAYMAPEQARGEPVDKRADIWAFGVVLYEMLTGRRLFQGETVSATLTAVLTKEPDWDCVPGVTQTLLRSCLEKDPRRRLRDIGDATLLLENAPSVGTRHQRPWATVATVLGLALIAFGVLLWRAMRPVERPLVRLVVDLGAEVVLPPLAQSNISVVLSPDGTRILYPSGSLSRLYTRRLDQSKVTELPGTDGAFAPFFSPDGRWVGFAAHGKLNKILVDGGPVVHLADVPNLFGGASWGTDGNIIASMPPTAGLVRIAESGGAPTTVVQQAPGEVAYLSPQILPGGKAVLYVAYKDPDLNTANVEVYSFADRRRKTLVAKGTSAHYLASGHLIYMQEGTLFAVPFDVDRLETHGPAVAILDDVAWVGQSGYANIDCARNGALIYRIGGDPVGLGLSSIEWLDGAGKKEPLGAKPGRYADPRLSPDGKRLALVVAEGGSQNVWVYDLQRDALTRLTFDPGIYVDPIWSPDGQYLVAGLIGKGIYLIRADHADLPLPLYQSRNFQIPFSFAPDGTRLAYQEQFPSQTIWTLPLAPVARGIKAGKAAQIVTTQSDNYTPAFSPDGRWLAYVSNESGKNEVYVTAFPVQASGAGAQWQISNSGGELPAWLASRHELIYKAGDQLMSVSYKASRDSFVASKPRVWIAKLGSQQFDLAPDGKRVLVLTQVETPDAPNAEHEVVLLENFFDYLRRRVPVTK